PTTAILIASPDWIASAIRESISAPFQRDGITRCPPSQPWCVVPSRVVLEARLLVALHPRVPIPLRRHVDARVHRPVCARPVRVVLLVRDEVPVLVDFYRRGSEVIAELIPPDPRRAPDRRATVDRLGLDDADPPRAVADVQRPALDIDAAVDALAVDLERPEGDALLRRGAGLLDVLAAALTASVLEIHRLAPDLDLLQLVVVIPHYARQVWHLGHV